MADMPYGYHFENYVIIATDEWVIMGMRFSLDFWSGLAGTEWHLADSQFGSHLESHVIANSSKKLYMSTNFSKKTSDNV